MIWRFLITIFLGLTFSFHSHGKPTSKKKGHIFTKTQSEKKRGYAKGILEGAWPNMKSPQLGNSTIRSETFVSALRLLGLRSFDENTFIRHIFYVNAISKKEAFPREVWVKSLMQYLAGKGLVSKKIVPKKGDIVFYSLDGKSKPLLEATNVLAGIVIAQEKQGVVAVAPINEKIVKIGPNTPLCKKEKRKPSCMSKMRIIGYADIESVAKSF